MCRKLKKNKKQKTNKDRTLFDVNYLGQIISIVHALHMKFGNLLILSTYITQELSP